MFTWVYRFTCVRHVLNITHCYACNTLKLESNSCCGKSILVISTASWIFICCWNNAIASLFGAANQLEVCVWGNALIFNSTRNYYDKQQRNDVMHHTEGSCREMRVLHDWTFDGWLMFQFKNSSCPKRRELCCIVSKVTQKKYLRTRVAAVWNDLGAKTFGRRSVWSLAGSHCFSL